MSSVTSLSPRSSMDSLYYELEPPVTGPMVWEGSELRDYVMALTIPEIESVRYAVLGYNLKNLPIEKIDKTTFELPAGLADKLQGLGKKLHEGRGVVVIRGLDKARFNDKEAVIAYVGICSYVCALRGTDSYANQTLSHIHDVTHRKVPAWAKGMGLAGSKIPDAMDFHSDRFAGDILSMHVRNDGGANSGGKQYLASFSKIYNTLLEIDPTVLETMATSNWPFELKQKDTAPYLELTPTLFFSQGRPMVQLVKAPLQGSPRIPRDPKMPTLSAEQMHALSVVEDLARRFSTELDRQKGDIQFINNLSIMHARTAYGNGKKRSDRHLLRMFLRDPENAWEKPAAWKRKFDDPFEAGRPQEIPVIDNDPHRKISGRDSHG